MDIVVIGLGYVGLPLALAFAHAGNRVMGIEIDPHKTGKLKQGVSPLRHIRDERIQAVIESGLFDVGEEIPDGNTAEAYIITVPTPLNRYREPDLSHVLAAGRAIGKVLRPGSLVVLESTTHPCTTDGELRTVLEEVSGLVAGKDFALAFSPEREDPGNTQHSFSAIPKIVGGYTDTCLKRAEALYGCIFDQLVPVSSCRTAEAAKLLENIFRSVNIALVNELKVIYRKMGIDIWEVIEAAKTKPFGFMAFYPGPGLGGHCIPVDPFYLSWKAREFGEYARFIELAGEVNTLITDHVVTIIMEALNSIGRSVKGSRILIYGVAYKPDIEDDRQSPSYAIMGKLLNLGAEIAYHDPHVGEILAHPFADDRIIGMKSIDLSEANVRSFDLGVVVTNHSAVDHKQCLEWSGCMVDCRNVLPKMEGKVWRA